MISLRLEAISKSYFRSKGQEICALRAIKCSIEAGEIISIIGPSGSGKSSLLKIISGIEESSCGEVKLDDVNVKCIPPDRRGIAIVFEDAPLYPNLSAFENLAMTLKIRSISRRKAEYEIAKISARFEFSECLNAFPDQLSKGQRQRIALARALLSRPRLLLLDEPFASLDPQLRYRLKREIVDWQLASGATLIFVTHDPYDAWTVGNRIAVMENGQLLQLDSPEKIRRAPINTFVAGFLGYPPMNLIKGRLIADFDKLHFESEGAEGAPFLAFDVPISLKKFASKSLIAGIAATDLCVQKKDLTDGSSMKIFRTEGFGGAFYGEFRDREKVLIARIGSEDHFKKGDWICLKVRAEKVVWFDAKSQKRIS